MSRELDRPNKRIVIVFDQVTYDASTKQGAIAIFADYDGRKITNELLDGNDATMLERLATWTLDAVMDKLQEMARDNPEGFQTATLNKDELN